MPRVGLKEPNPTLIWSDMSNDGPVIGTLRVELVKAKNLPNKKKLGKQDSYAVARLARVSQRTDNDVRGGQVPRWEEKKDFDVRDAPDYKNLKISVFADGKGVELIGETTVRLDNILVKGGEKYEGWRVLKCKDKYSGDIYIRLVFTDLRPKETKTKKAKEPTGRKEEEVDGRGKMTGAREMGTRREKTTTRGRPTPSDPQKEYSNSGKEAKASRKSRHSYHPEPTREPTSNSHHRSRSRHELSSTRSRRELRHSTSRLLDHNSYDMVMVPRSREPVRDEIYDPYNDDSYPEDFIPRNMPRNDGYDDRAYETDVPPPLPNHQRSVRQRAPSMRHSHSSGPMDMPVVIHQDDQIEHQLRHFRSVPAFQHEEANKRHSFDPRQLQQYGSSFPEHSYNFQPPQHSPRVGYGPDNRYDNDDPPSLSYGSTPRDDCPLDEPPPPPPPHRAQTMPLPPPTTEMETPLVDEPNWDNHRPKTLVEEAGLPTYDSIVKPPPQGVLVRRGSFNPGDMSPAVNGIPLPPSLVAGLDPIVAEDMAERMETEARMTSYQAPVQPLQIKHRPSTNYHRPQVEEVQDVQLYQSNLPQEEQVIQHPNTFKMDRSAPMVNPMPIHGESDNAVPAIGANRNSLRKNSVLNVMPERHALPGIPTEIEQRGLTGTPFGPDSYNVINPNPISSLEAYDIATSKMIMPGSNRVLDPSDFLPPDTHAPEPEPKGRRAPRAPPPVPMEHRRERFDRGDWIPVPDQQPRGPRLALPAPEQPLVKQVSFDESTTKRDRTRKSVRHSHSFSSSAGGMVLYDPHSERERERQMDRERAERDARALVPSHDNYGYQQRRMSMMEVRYYGRQQPQVPPKIPIQAGRDPRDEAYALSQEMSLINIGPIDGGRGGTYRGRR